MISSVDIQMADDLLGADEDAREAAAEDARRRRMEDLIRLQDAAK